jgi:hypothetical protein
MGTWFGVRGMYLGESSMGNMVTNMVSGNVLLEHLHLPNCRRTPFKNVKTDLSIVTSKAKH